MKTSESTALITKPATSNHCYAAAATTSGLMVFSSFMAWMLVGDLMPIAMYHRFIAKMVELGCSYNPAPHSSHPSYKRSLNMTLFPLSNQTVQCDYFAVHGDFNCLNRNETFCAEAESAADQLISHADYKALMVSLSVLVVLSVVGTFAMLFAVHQKNSEKNDETPEKSSEIILPGRA